MSIERPHRKYQLEINVEGDTWEDAKRLFKSCREHVDANGEKSSLVHGGYSEGGFVRVIHQPDMTPERYNRELDAYCESLPKEPPRRVPYPFAVFEPMPVLPNDAPMSEKAITFDRVVVDLPPSQYVASIISDAVRRKKIEGRHPVMALVGGEIYLALVAPQNLIPTMERYEDLKGVLLDRSLGDLEVRILCEQEEEMHMYLKKRAGR